MRVILVAILMMLLSMTAGVADVTPTVYAYTFQTAAGANGNGTTVICTGLSTVTATVTGTGTWVINFEVAGPEGTFRAIEGVSPTDHTAIASTLSAAGCLRFPVTGMSKFRARVSGWSSGAPTVTGTGTTALSWPLSMGGGGGGGLTIDATTITGGGGGSLLYDNAGTVGEIAGITYGANNLALGGGAHITFNYNSGGGISWNNAGSAYWNMSIPSGDALQVIYGSTVAVQYNSNGTMAFASNDVATASAGAATLNKQAGVITTESLSTSALGTYTLTLTNSLVTSGSIILCQATLGTSTGGLPVISKITPGSGTVDFVVTDAMAVGDFNGTVVIQFFIVNP